MSGRPRRGREGFERAVGEILVKREKPTRVAAAAAAAAARAENPPRSSSSSSTVAAIRG